MSTNVMFPYDIIQRAFQQQNFLDKIQEHEPFMLCYGQELKLLKSVLKLKLVIPINDYIQTFIIEIIQKNIN